MLLGQNEVFPRTGGDQSACEGNPQAIHEVLFQVLPSTVPSEAYYCTPLLPKAGSKLSRAQE